MLGEVFPCKMVKERQTPSIQPLVQVVLEDPLEDHQRTLWASIVVKNDLWYRDVNLPKGESIVSLASSPLTKSK